MVVIVSVVVEVERCTDNVRERRERKGGESERGGKGGGGKK